MARFSRLEVVQTMTKQGIVPLFYHGDIHLAKKVVTACYLGGCRVVEFTHRGDFALEVFSDLNKFIIKELPELILGVGSVTDAALASGYMAAGANFVVTPVFRKDIAIVCNRRKVPWFPGCATLTEICQAEELGCEVVKLFPGESFGPSFVKAIKGPQPWTSIMPTGGVTTEESNLSSWFDAGVTCVGLGSNLISKTVIQQNNFDELTNKCKQVLQIVQKIRQKK